jgi:hypothetical protein
LEGPVRVRIAATVVVAASLLLSTAGCSFFSPQMVKQYSPSDGVDTTVGQVKIRNALLLTRDGNVASLLVSLVNDGSKTVNVLIQYDGTTASGAPGKVDTRVQLDAGEVKTFGSSDTRQLLFNGIDSKPGSLFPVFVQYGTLTGAQLRVPVLDGSLSEYSKLLPTPLPTATPSANPTVIPVPTPTPSK